MQRECRWGRWASPAPINHMERGIRHNGRRRSNWSDTRYNSLCDTWYWTCSQVLLHIGPIGTSNIIVMVLWLMHNIYGVNASETLHVKMTRTHSLCEFSVCNLHSTTSDSFSTKTLCLPIIGPITQLDLLRSLLAWCTFVGFNDFAIYTVLIILRLNAE